MTSTSPLRSIFTAYAPCIAVLALLSSSSGVLPAEPAILIRTAGRWARGTATMRGALAAATFAHVWAGPLGTPCPLGPWAKRFRVFSMRDRRCSTGFWVWFAYVTVSYTHLRAHETRHDLVCRLLLE